MSWVTCRILRTFQVWPRAVLAPGLWPVQRKEREKNRFLNYIRICANYVYGYVAFQSKILNSFDFALFYPLNKTCLKGARFFPYFISVPFFQINMKAYWPAGTQPRRYQGERIELINANDKRSILAQVYFPSVTPGAHCPDDVLLNRKRAGLNNNHQCSHKRMRGYDWT